ncbi:MAG TPA: sugar transferase [Longimicrobiales bacterium]|nr:sugar transferase [Longimicrobiales bacterium]
MTGYERAKRLLDFAAAALALALLSPIVLLTALAVRVKLGRPVVFRQLRPGLREKPFTLYKFRTMLDLRDADGRLLHEEERTPPFGRFLRSCSLDELPTLLNVLRGDLSLVGPRPLLMRYLGRYTPEQARRHDVRPGITGWAQVSGRNGLTWEEKFACDVWYVEHRSFALDLRILLRTVGTVLRRSNVFLPRPIHEEEFWGTARPEGGADGGAAAAGAGEAAAGAGAAAAGAGAAAAGDRAGAAVGGGAGAEAGAGVGAATAAGRQP